MNKSALISTIFAQDGGVKTMRDFVIQILRDEGFTIRMAYYKPYRIDQNLSVPFWKIPFKKPQLRKFSDNGIDCYEAGVALPEFEFMRYRSGKFWDEAVSGVDVCLSVSGCPLAAYPFKKIGRRFIGWFATTYLDDLKGRDNNVIRRLIDLFNRDVCLNMEDDIVGSGCAHLLTLSRYTKNLLEKRSSPANPIDILYMPIDLDLFYPAENREPHSIVLAARFSDPRKNVRLAIEVIGNLVNNLKLSDVKLYLIGDKLTAENENLIRSLNIQNNIVSIPYISRSELADYYRKSSVFLLTSWQEGLGIAIFEAMACGCVPVITKCGGPEELIVNDGNGYTVNFDPQNIAETIYCVFTRQGAFERLSKEAIETVNANFSMIKQKERFLKKLYTITG
ncbi:MAG: glycosyltransferase family 4 protein [Planctomycetes bacterium]|nr:glycosyltransferase family 4 protein [Planctomycetota bacterium]